MSPAMPVTASPSGQRETHILVVEDDFDIGGLIKHAFEREGGVDVEIVGSGTAALQAVDSRVPDLVILDLNLPDLDGFHVCRLLRTRPHAAGIPIIVVTARLSEADRVHALDLGADDYLTKPFGLRELAARARAVLRRRRADTKSLAVYAGRHLTADFAAVSVAVDGAPVRLTRREFELLQCLVENRSRVLSRDQLLQRLWAGAHHVETRTIDVHLGRLRAKLGPAGRQIETVFGIGYRFVEEPVTEI